MTSLDGLRKVHVKSWEPIDKRLAPKSYRDKFHSEVTDIVTQFVKDHPEQFEFSINLWCDEKINSINETINELKDEIHRLENGIAIGNKARSGGWDEKIAFQNFRERK